MKARAPYKDVGTISAEHRLWGPAIRQRLAEFAAIAPDDYFYELIYCLLTPQSSAVNAGKAIEALRAHKVHDADVPVASLLHGNDFYIRFHRTKARHIAEAKKRFADIQAALLNGSGSKELRAWLVHNVRGLGWKEASHFLRNIGHRDLAILDRHILRNLHRHGVLRSIPRSLTPRRYLQLEERFARFAAALGIPMDELDLLFWRRETGQILK